jgi:RNA polymerase sigma factor (sigma-70 family)
MTNGPLNLVVQHIRKIAGGEEQTDGDLLERFTSQHEEAVFDALLRRYGPLVLGVCQRVLNHEQDAEDAFQATFLVLARRAGSIRKQASLGSWLYGVSYRLALKLKAGAARRRALERRLATMPPPQPSDETAWQELRPALDVELSKLPEKYRAPLVLCYLEGKTHAEAAQVLGWPCGSMSKRLTRARDLLRARLRERGVALSTGLLATLLMENARAAVPAALAESSSKAAVLVATGKAVTGVVSAHVAALAEGVMRTMLITKLKLGLLLLFGMAVLAAATGLANSRLAQEQQTEVQPGEPERPVAPARHPPDLALVPNDAMGFARIAVHELWNGGLFRRVRQQPATAGLDTLLLAEKYLGVRLDEIETVTAILLPLGEPNVSPPILYVFTTTQPYAPEKIRLAVAPEGKQQQYKTKSYSSAEGTDQSAVHFVSDRIFIVAKLPVLRHYFDLSTDPRPERPLGTALRLAEQNHDVVIGFYMTEQIAQQVKQEPLPAQMAFLKPLLEIQSGTLTIDFAQDAQARTRLQLADEVAAENAADALQSGVGVLKQMLAAVPETAKQDLLTASLLNEAGPALRSVKITREKATVSITAHANGATVLSSALPGIQKSRMSASRMVSANNLKQMALAMHNYAAAYNHLPPAAITDKTGKPLLSWRVAILPFIEQEALYREFHLDEPWDSEHNRKLLTRMPKIYAPVNVLSRQPHTTYYQVFTGKTSVFEDPEGCRFTDITDGMSNTLLIVEAADAVPWTKPEDLPYAPNRLLPKLGGEFSEGFDAAFCDGSVRFLSKTVPEKMLRALITRNGGERMDGLPPE